MSRDMAMRQHEPPISASEAMHPLVDALMASDARVDISFWYGSTITREAAAGTLSLRPRASCGPVIVTHVEGPCAPGDTS